MSYGLSNGFVKRGGARFCGEGLLFNLFVDLFLLGDDRDTLLELAPPRVSRGGAAGVTP